MGIEEKAKAYDEALEKAKVHINNKGIGDTVDLCKHLFPELRDSEDERARKAALEGIEYLERKLGWDAIGDTDILDVKEYLEKQKEPTKEELYAEAGTTEKEYIANTMKMVRAMREKKQDQKPNIELIQRSWYMEGYNERDFGKESKWIIKTGDDGPEYEENPKYGQMLEAEQNPTWSEEDKQWLSEVYFAIDHSMYFRDERRSMKKYIDSLRSQSKTAEWSEEDEKMLADTIFKLAGFMGNEKNIDWLKSLRPQPREEIYQSAKHDLAIKFMNYLDENRPEGKMSLSNGECEDIDKAFKENDWAKIMRYVEKYSPQPKVVWSEEDEQFLLICKNALYKYQRTDQWDANIISKWLDDKLKSLRPSWKPSEEQMEALRYVAYKHGNSSLSPYSIANKTLASLYEQLKKL